MQLQEEIRVSKLVKPHDFKVGDLVPVRNHTSKAFQEKLPG